MGDEGWVQTEVAYDPAVGYLPRHCRILSSYTGDPTWVKEFALVDARPCAAGGFVPTEWYVATFGVDDFDRKYPDYSDETNLMPSSGRLGLVHFLATSFRDRTGTVAMTELDGIRAIETDGGRVELAPGTRSLSLGTIKSRLGSSLTNPSPRPALPGLDVDELQAFAAPTPPDWTSYAAGVVILAAAALATAVVVRRRRLTLAVLVGLSAGAGCEPASDPVITLTGAFRESYSLYDVSEPTLPMTLVISNEGNRAVRLLKADAGCTCRKVDQASLPSSLEPDQSLEIEVWLGTDRLATRQGVVFHFETDHGPINVPTEFHTFPRHQFDPESRSHTALVEDEDWSFDIVQRSIFRSDQPEPATELVVPPELAVEVEGAIQGLVGTIPELAYRDTTYRISLKDRSPGLHKAIVSLQGPDRDPLVEAPIVWQRVPFLSSTPDRVHIGARPVRVFLRCPDESVELTRILAAPDGVQAVISSSREMIVKLAEGAPGIIDGLIEVATTAEDRDQLRIPIVRYAPTARDEAL